jgi:membrane-associated phospholipid phosphatase
MRAEGRNRWVLMLAGAFAWTALTDCKRAETERGEPSGGSWRPILLSSPDTIKVPPPPAEASDQEKAETDELLKLQKERTEQSAETARFWNAGACVRWNEIARDFVAKHRASHPMASRAYALLSVAQYDALVATWHGKYQYGRRTPHDRSAAITPLFAAPRDPVYPSEHAAVAAASAAVLAYLFPEEAQFLRGKLAEHESSRLVAGVDFPSDIVSGDAVGVRVGALVVEHAVKDGSDAPEPRDLPVDEERWTPPSNTEPMDSHWAKVRPWLLSAADQFRAPAPPASSSNEFRDALAEVRRFSDTRTQEQARLAALWADGLGSYAPSGRWNKIAADLIVAHGLNEIRAARSLALVNMALMDAGISAWETKYHYLTRRPSQVDPNITTPVGEPNTPSYTCSHAAFSAAGASVLGYLFPDKKDALDARAEEAAMSRVYGGVQFRFEGEAGLSEGRAVAKLAIARGSMDGSSR